MRSTTTMQSYRRWHTTRFRPLQLTQQVRDINSVLNGLFTRYNRVDCGFSRCVSDLPSHHTQGCCLICTLVGGPLGLGWARKAGSRLAPSSGDSVGQLQIPFGRVDIEVVVYMRRMCC